MSKYEKKGTITFSPTAITDKEEVHELHSKVNETSGSAEPTFCGIDMIIHGEWDLNKLVSIEIAYGNYTSVRDKLLNDLPVIIVISQIVPESMTQPRKRDNYLACGISYVEGEDYFTIQTESTSSQLQAYIHEDGRIEYTIE